MVWEVDQYFFQMCAAQEQRLHYWIVGMLQFHYEHSAHIIVILELNVKVSAAQYYCFLASAYYSH